MVRLYAVGSQAGRARPESPSQREHGRLHVKLGALELRAGRCAIIAEPSCNHVGDYRRAVQLIHHAKDSGADAIKFQCCETSDLTRRHRHSAYHLASGPWADRSLWDLYTEAQTRYSWMPGLIYVADDIGLPWFASVVSARGLDILNKLGCPAYKIPSAEVADARFVELVASVGKPVILSDGMATPDQMGAALAAVMRADSVPVVLKCVSEYPAKPEGYNLRTLLALREAEIPCGVSDHTTGKTVPIMAATLGAQMLEKHLMASDCMSVRPLDYEHSLAPLEFRAMVDAVRDAEAAMGSVVLGASPDAGKGWRRRLVAARDLPAGHVLAAEDVATARCGEGLEPDDEFEGMILMRGLREGEPVTNNVLSVFAA